MSTAAQFASLRSQVTSDSISKTTYANITQAANDLLTKPVLTYSKPDGIRILDTSREMVERAYTLGFTWQITGDSKYAERLWKDLDAVTRFTDWNPDHFLDTAEMTHGVAIGYDWLYSYWSTARRTQLSKAIANLGLQPALAVYDAPADSAGPYAYGGNWAQGSSNWNIVVNSGMAVGAIAIAQDNPTLSDTILKAAIASVPKGIATFAPDGGEPEGLSYWDYAARYLVVMLQSLRTATKSDSGLGALPGVSKIGYFPIYMTTPTGNRFNFSDSEQGTSRTPALVGLGALFDNASFTYAGVVEGRGGNLVQRLLWYSPSRTSTSPTAANLPLDRNFANAAVASFRSSWNNPNATFVGYRTGSLPDAAHQNLDAGSFNFDALGENWAMELGKDDYGLAGYFDTGSDGDRWNYYRLGAEGQNTLVINPYTPRSTSVAATPAATFASNTASGFSVSDLSALYPNDVSSWKRGVKLVGARQEMVVQDEITSSKPFEAMWSMHTAANISIASDGRSATLTLNGKQVLARIASPGAAKFVDSPAAPLPSSPHPAQQNSNPGVRKLTIALSASGNTTLAVQLTPLTSALTPGATAAVTPLARWALETDGASRASGVRVNGVNIPGFSPGVLQYTTVSDPGAAVPIVAAYKTGATVTSTKPASIPGIATTTITEPGKSPTTYTVLIDRGPITISSATATRTTSGTPALTYDGDPETYWSTWQDNSITYTLAQTRSLASTLITWRANTSKHTKYEIQTSTNGTTWATQYSGAYDGPSGSKRVVLKSAPSAKYVRIVGHGDEASDPRTSISEVQFFGYDSTPPSSSPDPARLASVRVSGVPTSMSKTQTAKLAVSALDASGKSIASSSFGSVTYVSGDPSVASISSTGAVTAQAGGTTTVGVIVTVDGVSETATAAVTVTDPTRLRLYATKDSYVRGGTTAGKNYGTEGQLAVKPTAGSTDESFVRLAYMGFDLSGIQGKQVLSAILSVNASITEPTGDAARLDAHAVDASWTETGLTYSNRPSLGATVGSMTVNRTAEYQASDLTDYVNSKAAASARTMSLGFTEDTPFVSGKPLIVQLKSRESSAMPYIDVILKATPSSISSAKASLTTTGSAAATYDNDTSTYWSASKAGSVTYTMAQSLPVKSATISWRANSSKHTKYEVQTSSDAAAWKTTFDGAFDGSTGSKTIVMPNGSAAKYVRIVGHGDEASDPTTAISEVKFYSVDVTEAAPARLPAHLASFTVGGLPASIPLSQTAQINVAAKNTAGGAMAASAVAVTYASSDTAVLAVNSYGVVSADKVGSASIDVTVSSNGASYTQTVAVAVTDPTRLRIYANADSYVRGGSTAGTNYGTESKLSVKPNTGSADESFTRLTYMGFDLTSIKGKTVASATLTVDAAITASTGDSARLDAHAVEGTWTESGLTFSNRPGFGSTVASITLNRTSSYRSGDITGYVKMKAAASAKTLSLGFTEDAPFVGGEPLILQLRSREAPNRPYVDVVLK